MSFNASDASPLPLRVPQVDVGRGTCGTIGNLIQFYHLNKIVIMLRGHKYRIYPNTEQQIALAKNFGYCRGFSNHALNLCQQTHLETGKGLSRNAIQSPLPNLKREHPVLKDAYSQRLQVVALNSSTVHKNFFEKRGKLPRFKSTKGGQSISFFPNFTGNGNALKLSKIG